MPGTDAPKGYLPTLADRVISVVDANTSPKQPDDVRRSTVVRILSRSTRDGDRGGWQTVVSSDDVREAIDAALDDGRLAESDGRLRVVDGV